MSFQSILEIQVRQKSKFTDEHIGQIRIPVTSLVLSDKLRKTWYKLAARPGKTSSKIRGDILIATCFLSKWDTKEPTISSFTDLDISEQSDRMLRRTKSEYRSKSKGSPKPDKSKQKSVFDRLRKNKSNVFEECEDFVSVRSPESPPTPISNDRKKLTASSSVDFNGEQLLGSSLPNSSSDFKEMFSEATQLEKTGVLDLSRVDPVTRLELGRQMFESTIDNNNSNEDSVRTDMVSPKLLRVLSGF